MGIYGAWLERAMVLASLWQLFVPMSVAQVDPSCDLFQNMVLGQDYYVFNRQYPSPYTSNTYCRWEAVSEPGTRIVVACEDVDLPASTNCNGDRLAISLTGRQDLTDAHNYCGKGTFTVISESNALVIGLISTGNTAGGKFVCTLTAITDETADPVEPPAVCNCGWQNALRIVNGHETGVNEFPSMAALIDTVNRDLYCGSSIISDRYVLTVGHCLYNRDYQSISVLVGDHNVSTGADTPYAALYRVQAYEIHPDFNPTTLANDVGLIRTQTTITFSLYVGPICLPFRFTSQSFTGQTVSALGWGALGFTENKSDTLQEIEVSVVSHQECLAGDSTVTNKQICTYADGKDMCQSDSGGPVIWIDTNTGRLHQVGIISFGLACGSANPSVNTRVTSYLGWIIERTSDASYCIK